MSPTSVSSAPWTTPNGSRSVSLRWLSDLPATSPRTVAPNMMLASTSANSQLVSLKNIVSSGRNPGRQPTPPPPGATIERGRIDKLGRPPDDGRAIEEAFGEARRLGHHWVGVEHLLLALTAGPPGRPCRHALDACEVREAALREKLAASRSWPRPPDPAGGIWPSPLLQTVAGRATGFAAAEGAPASRPEHLLLALAWEPHGRHSRLVGDLAVTSARLQAALADAGVAFPALEPPPFVRASAFGEPVTSRRASCERSSTSSPCSSGRPRSPSR